MQYLVFILGVVILLVVFVTRMLLSSMKERDLEYIEEIMQEVEYEKAHSQLYDRENHLLELQKKKVEQQLLQVRLDLLNTENDLKDIIPRLIN